MELVRGLYNLCFRHRSGAVTIGNFDGVHRGHQAVLAGLQQRAGALGLPTTLVTFEPTPQEYFAPVRAPARLTRLREKAELLGASGLNTLLCLRFDARLAALDPQAFIRRILVEGLAARHVMVGDDFRFGRDRAGDFALLERAGKQAGFSVERTATFEFEGARVSSTRVRAALAAGDLALAGRLLGRDYSISGRVVYGEQLGRKLGYPTANIRLRRVHVPLQGVFVVRVEGSGLPTRYGVANVGTRPTVSGGDSLLEAHLFDFSGALYGRCLRVYFLHKLREELKFADLETLRAHIGRDAVAGREWLARQARE